MKFVYRRPLFQISLPRKITIWLGMFVILFLIKKLLTLPKKHDGFK